jgi:hypothetical protein
MSDYQQIIVYLTITSRGINLSSFVYKNFKKNSIIIIHVITILNIVLIFFITIVNIWLTARCDKCQITNR